MNRAEALNRLAESRVATLATIRDDGRAHLVPVTFAIAGGVLVTMVDHKPKSTTRLRRIRNIEANPNVTVLADHYTEEWDRLWWVRVDGTAAIHHQGERWDAAARALIAKYDQYDETSPKGPAIWVEIEEVRWWESIP